MPVSPDDLQQGKAVSEGLDTGTRRPWSPPPWLRVVQAVWLVFVLLFLAFYFYRHWSQFQSFSWDIAPAWIVGALLFSLLRRMLGSLRWVAITLYPNGPWTRSHVLRQMSVYFISGLALYIPGNIWFVANRIYLSRRIGMSTVKSSLALIYETGLMIWSSIIIASYVGFSLLISSKATLIFLGILLAILSFGLFHQKTVAFALRKMERIAKRPIAKADVSSTWVAGLLFISFSILILGGASLYCVFKALGVEDPGSLIYVISALTLAWTLGFCTPWAPSGLGVQEGFIIYLFSYLATPVPAVAAICMRLLYVFEDALWGGLSLIIFSGQQPVNSPPK